MDNDMVDEIVESLNLIFIKCESIRCALLQELIQWIGDFDNVLNETKINVTKS